MQVTVTVKRPTGEVEVVDKTQNWPNGIPRQRLDEMIAATRKAGRGEIIACSHILDFKPVARPYTFAADPEINAVLRSERAGDINRFEQDGN